MAEFDPDDAIRRAREAGPRMTRYDEVSGDYYSVPAIGSVSDVDFPDEPDDENPNAAGSGTPEGPPSDLIESLLLANAAYKAAETAYKGLREQVCAFLGPKNSYVFSCSSGSVRIQKRPMMRPRSGVAAQQIVEAVDGLGLLAEMATIPATRLWKYYRSDPDVASSLEVLVEQYETPYVTCIATA